MGSGCFEVEQASVGYGYYPRGAVDSKASARRIAEAIGNSVGCSIRVGCIRCDANRGAVGGVFIYGIGCRIGVRWCGYREFVYVGQVDLENFVVRRTCKVGDANGDTVTCIRLVVQKCSVCHSHFAGRRIDRESPTRVVHQ